MLKAITAPTLQEVDFKQEMQALEKVKGWERGGVLKNLFNFIERKEEKKNLDRLLKKLEQLGYEIPAPNKVLKTQWVPERTIAYVGTAAGKMFNWTEKDFKDIGRTMVSLSLLSRLYISYFSSLSKTFQHLKKTYKKYISEGYLEVVYIDEKKKEAKWRIHGLDIHPTACLHFEGVIEKIIEIATNSDKVKVKELKCSFFDKVTYHEYKVNW